MCTPLCQPVFGVLARLSTRITPAIAPLILIMGAAEAQASTALPESLRDPWHADYRLQPPNPESPRLSGRDGSSALHKGPWWSSLHYGLVPVSAPGSANGNRVPGDAFAAALLRAQGATPTDTRTFIGFGARFNDGHSKFSLAPRAQGVRIRFSHEY
ncbi:hypothetical protein PV762_02590 [Mitsuaria sp. CC2]|uniref:hypothetical protein n=1 Tax=Mitsuaria sp. CC2 TaxID=3029186 RepID=UPI003B8D3332